MEVGAGRTFCRRAFLSAPLSMVLKKHGLKGILGLLALGLPTVRVFLLYLLLCFAAKVRAHVVL